MAELPAERKGRGVKMSCSKSEAGWCDKENSDEWNYCPDCEVVGELEKLEEQNAELLKEVAELKGQLNRQKE
jgi:hypothetical protein